MHNNAYDPGTGCPQARRPPVIDITDGPGMFLDFFTRLVGDKRTVAQCQRNGGRRNTKRVCDGRKLDFLSQVASPKWSCHSRNRMASARQSEERPSHLADGYAIAIIELKVFSARLSDHALIPHHRHQQLPCPTRR